MASSEVDLKALSKFAGSLNYHDPFLSAVLYRILGLSVMLSKKLLRARSMRRLDPTRETKSHQLYHHIVWLSREGLLMLEECVLPMVEQYVELKVLAHKLRASFFHLFALFHNEPPIRPPGFISTPNKVEHVSRRISGEGSSSAHGRNAPPQPQPHHPPGLRPVRPPKPSSSSSFLIPALDYTPTATACFNHAVTLADRLLPGSNPLRLSVKLEYAAFLHDCLHDADASRRVARQTIADVYSAQEGMDDASFEDAAGIVNMLGKMAKRGLGVPSTGEMMAGGIGGNLGNGGGTSLPRPMATTTTTTTTPTLLSRSRTQRSPTARGPGPGPVPGLSEWVTNDGRVIAPAVPNPAMVNPI